jgi:DnaK suppressor protein
MKLMSNPSNVSPLSPLDKTFVEQQRRRLLALREELLGGERRRTSAERAELELHGDEAMEFEDDAQNMAQREIDLATRHVNDRRIRSIERALRKIELGNYGISDESGRPIPKARLEFTPEAIYTIEEERRREARG